MIEEGTYFIGWSWVMTELKLSGNEAIVYMIINGFSRKGRAWFTGSAGYLAEASNCSRATAMRVLKKLTNQGLLKKRVVTRDGVTYCDYQTVVPAHVRERYGYMEEEAEEEAAKEAQTAKTEELATPEVAETESMESKETEEVDWSSFLKAQGVAKPVPPSKRVALIAQYEAFKQRLKAVTGAHPPMAFGGVGS